VTVHHGSKTWAGADWEALTSSAGSYGPDLTPHAILTSEQAAEYLQVSLRTIKKLMSDGQLAYIKVGRSTRLHRDDIDDYLARNRRKRRHGLRAS
jgi:excisionase family DNA binding protein